MRILVVSDTHRKNDAFLSIVEAMEPFDAVIHCGDVEGCEYVISEAAGCESFIVAGNNDFFSSLPREIETTIGKYKVLITHGHNYYVSMNYDFIKQDAVNRGFDLVFFGHTHKPVVDKDRNITLVNPGSLTYPRQDGRRPSFVIMDIDKTGEAHFTIRYL